MLVKLSTEQIEALIEAINYLAENGDYSSFDDETAENIDSSLKVLEDRLRVSKLFDKSREAKNDES